MKNAYTDWLIFSLGAILCALCYGPSLEGEFLWDDMMGTINSLVTSPGQLDDIWFTLIDYDYWPLTKTLLWIEYRLFGEWPTGYRIISLALHLVIAGLLLKLARQWKIKGAAIATLLFLLHPVAVPVVAWITQQKTLLMVLFVILSTIYLDKCSIGKKPFRKSFHYYLSIIFFILACLSKTVCIAFPFIVIVIISIRREQISLDSSIVILKSMFGRLRTWARAATYFLISLVLAYITVLKQTGGNAETYSVELPGRIASFGWSFWFYIKNTIFPYKLAFVYPLWNQRIEELGFVGYLPLLGAIALVAITLFTIRRKLSLWVLFTVAAYVTLMFPTMNFFKMAYTKFSMTADFYHYAGLPTLLFGFIAYISSALNPPSNAQRNCLRVLSIITIAGLAFITYQRSHYFQSEIELWEGDLKSNPISPYSAARLSGMLVVGPTFKLLNQIEKVEVLKRGIELTQMAIRVQPKLLTAYVIHARILMRQDKNDEAIAVLLDAEIRAKNLKSGIDLTYIYQNLSLAYIDTGRDEDALSCLQNTIFNPLISIIAYKRICMIYKRTRAPIELLTTTLRLINSPFYKTYPGIRQETIAICKLHLHRAGRSDLAEQLP